MKNVDVTVESQLIQTPRVKQLSAIFDAPLQSRLTHHWAGELPLDEQEWNIGLIVGPSGAGKSTVARQLFGEPRRLSWRASSVIDDFRDALPIKEITDACSAVGFNTIPSWMKPFKVLSTGEQFRVALARHLIEGGDLIVVDEFSSVVDRQVAKIGSHAVQKYARKRGKKFVAVTCHYDVVDWLQPDWVLEPATMTFQWRSVQRRPSLEIEIARVDHEAWKLFAPFHYLTAELNTSAACYVLFVDGVPASFAGVLNRPHPRVGNIRGMTRNVTLPDYQGLGLIFVLIDALGSIYKAAGFRFRNYPAHPEYVRALDRSPHWRLEKRPGVWSSRAGDSSSAKAGGGRPCAVFEYIGPVRHSREEAKRLLAA